MQIKNIIQFFGTEIDKNYHQLTLLVNTFLESDKNLTKKNLTEDMFNSIAWKTYEKNIEVWYNKICTQLPFDIRNIDRSFSFKKIYPEGKTLSNHPNTFHIIKNMVKWQTLLTIKDLNNINKDLVFVIAVNTIRKRSFLAGLTASESIANPDSYWWNMKNITKVVDEIMEEIKANNKVVVDYNYKPVYGEKWEVVCDFLKEYGLVKQRPAITHNLDDPEWYIKCIGDSSTMAEAINKIIAEEPGLYYETARYRIKKLGLDKTLGLTARPQNKRKKTN